MNTICKISAASAAMLLQYAPQLYAQEPAATESSDQTSNTVLYIALGIIVLLMLIVVMVIRSKRPPKPTVIPGSVVNRPQHQGAPADPGSGIVVGRKTTSVLRKQCIDDVINNPAYMPIDCQEFCPDSTVSRIFVRNTCIRQIYDMYADDLRNADNPKEDGCMVLGRWVLDRQTQTYAVTLEEIVKPGDDAVFQEYELNFGGKIKFKVSQRLRALRAETALQYDMTCWVHSHPGLGVFFSNADTSVHDLLKNPTHPNFLVAFVIDILTPQQELGIFTFRRDGSILSKGDLLRMYSLEEWYQWAVKSGRDSFNADDHYNLLQSAAQTSETCAGLQLSNGAIIDICRAVVDDQQGLVGWIEGFTCRDRGLTHHVMQSMVTPANDAPSPSTIGCLVVGTHCSVPTIRKVVADCADRLQFVLFYSTVDETLTGIPMSDGDLQGDDQFFGEEKLENLKIWTRRKR